MSINFYQVRNGMKKTTLCRSNYLVSFYLLDSFKLLYKCKFK